MVRYLGFHQENLALTAIHFLASANSIATVRKADEREALRPTRLSIFC